MNAESTSSLTIRDHNISCISVIGKNFLKTISELYVCAPLAEELRSRIDTSVLWNVDLNLSVLRYDGIYLRYIQDIWEIVGVTLEEVHLEVSDDNAEWIQSMNQMKEHCRQSYDWRR